MVPMQNVVARKICFCFHPSGSICAFIL